MRRLPALLAALTTILAVGCASGPGPSASSAPTARDPSIFPVESATLTQTAQPFAVVSIQTRGGLCSEGPCVRLVNIEGDATLHEVIPRDRVLGTIPGPLFEALRAEVERANYPLLRSKPFTGECPTAFDGQEAIYTFHAPTGAEEIASCNVAIDPNHPLFLAVAAALAAAGGL